MARRRHTAEQVIHLLRQAAVGLANGKTVQALCRELEISEQVSQARRLKELEKENARLKQAVADLTLDKMILQEALRKQW